MLKKANWLTLETPELVADLLKRQAIFEPQETLVRLQPAGEGNMNVTLRAESDRRSVIVKQSRPFVAKYDSIPAPLERIEFEAAFYRLTESHQQVSGQMPRLLAWLPTHYVLVLEDLGPAADATCLYADYPQVQLPDVIASLVMWLKTLHELSKKSVDVASLDNRALRQLNHAHIFQIPFLDAPAIDLDSVCPGLSAATQTLRTDDSLRRACLELGELYLSEGDFLLHGDFYPGSWLLSDRGAMVIDPEFCFAGPAEFDLGVLLAHLQLIGCQSPLGAIQDLVADAPVYAQLSWTLVSRFAAVEVLRRLLGVAQLPLTMNLAARAELVQSAHDELLAGPPAT